MTQACPVESTDNITVEQCLGDQLTNWTDRSHPIENPEHETLQGQYCRLEVLRSTAPNERIQQIYDALKPTEEINFAYLRYGPFATIDQLKNFIEDKQLPHNNIVLYGIVVNNIALGYIGYLRISREQGTIEIGHVNFSRQVARTREATESVYLLLQHAFDTLGYIRVEWKCNALNSKSRQAAIRFGFQYEGTWLIAEVTKGRSRDNSWYSIVDDEWPLVKREFER